MPSRVIVVEDDASMLRLLRTYLEQDGYQVIAADNGADAYELLIRRDARLVVTDWLMPEMNGLELCRAIRSNPVTESDYVIVLTAQSQTSDLVDAFQAGADDFLSKPFHREELTARVQAGQRIIDLQDILLAQQTLARERDHLREAVSALEQVLGVVAHELRTPLAGTRVMTEFLLQNDARNEANLEAYLRGIHDELVRMSDTINDVLMVATMNGDHMQWNWSEVNMSQVCEQALNAIRPLIDASRVRLESSIDPQELVLRGDANALRRLLTNLLSNAQKHTQDGFIRVSISAQQEEGHVQVLLRVSDTGEGLPMVIADRLGIAFALNSGIGGSRHVEGCGLGLSICQGIAAAHGGSIHIESGCGTGTTVTVTLRADLSEPASSNILGDLTTRLTS